LTNPLLTIMMLLTLGQFAEVPAKIHLFYEYAFEALFGRHDATKGAYQRKRHTNLALDDFKRLFSYFCMLGYLRGLYNFSSGQLLELLQQSIGASQIDVDKVLFRNDLTESTCMLVMDGLDYAFSHRSFQEYFCAYFLARIKTDEFVRALPQLLRKGTFDNVFKMISEMNKEKFEASWALPNARRLYESIENVNPRLDSIKFVLRMLEVKKVHLGYYPYLIVDPNHRFRELSVSILDETTSVRSQLRTALYRTYNLHELIKERIRARNQAVRDDEVVSAILAGTLLTNDPRVDALRKMVEGKEIDMEFELRVDDSKWLEGTSVSILCEAEKEVLKAFMDDMSHRVAERERGLSLFFPAGPASTSVR
jgi:hypothetical protein